MVRVVDSRDRVVSTDLLSGSIPDAIGGGSGTSASEAVDGDTSLAAVGKGGGRSQQDGGGTAAGPQLLRTQLVLLDFGLAEELTPEVRHHFISFLSAICAGHGRRASRHLLKWGARQRCCDRQAFERDIVAMFEAECDIHAPRGIDLDKVGARASFMQLKP
jgi:aarF domain-containing kinase